MHTPLRDKYHRHGFTLIELMVVVGILIILASILIPTVSGAFRVARSKKDLTQQRGIYQAMVLHAAGNESKFPLPSTIVDTKNYIDTINIVLICPHIDDTNNSQTFYMRKEYSYRVA